MSLSAEQNSLLKNDNLAFAKTQEIEALLDFYIQLGVRDILSDEPRDWRKPNVDLSEIFPNSQPARAGNSDKKNDYSARQTEPRLKQTAPELSASPELSRSKAAFAAQNGIYDPQSARLSSVRNISLKQAIDEAQQAAESAANLAELEMALRAFDGCPLKRMAKHTVFSDGQNDAKIMFVGEAPASDEDRVGRPFVGSSGQLLDDMLACIGLDRQKNIYLANVLFWRPPGNRTPNAEELAVCAPFIRKQIALVKPELLVFVGGIAAKSLLNVNLGISKLRGQWQVYQDGALEIPALPILHPAYLLRQPLSKRFAWQDCLALREKAQALGLDLLDPEPQEARR